MLNSKEIEISKNSIILAKSGIELKEEEDGWAILFNPSTDYSFGINPVSVFVWKQLEKKITFKELICRVKENCINVHDEVEDHVGLFIEQLLRKELATVSNNY